MTTIFATAALALGVCGSAGATSYYPKVVTAAGDYNGGSQAGQTAAAMAAVNPIRVLGLGDYQYEYGAHDAFVSGFQTQMVNNGIPLAKIKPTAGPTHDVSGPADTANYFSNWGRDPFTAYSFNVGPQWHFISLPSPIYRYNMTTNQSSTLTWLQNDLAANTRDCVVAYWHEPFFTNTSSGHSASEGDYTKPWVDALYAAHADILLAGHQHGYARFKSQTPDKVLSAAGLRNYVVGTGGVGFYSWSTGEPNLVTQQANTFGALKLTLWPHRWAADFIQSGGSGYTDHSTGTCHL